MPANPKHANFISRYRQSIEAILTNLEELDDLAREAGILDYANTITADDFEGENSHLDRPQLVAAFQSVTALDDFLAANGNEHYANLYEVKR